MDVHAEYAYTVFYPDPDRDHYLLEDTTKSNLDFTARLEDGVFVFEAGGVKGHLEFGHKYLWLVIEESSDQRFQVGYHCCEVYNPEEWVD